MIVFSVVACKNEPTPNNVTENTENQAIVNTPVIETTKHPIVEYYQNKNGVPIYNGFVKLDTINISSGNKYILDIVAYDLWGKFFYLNKKYEVVATDNPDEITNADLGTFHPYLLRISTMDKPSNWVNPNVQTVEVSISDNGVSNIKRTDFLNARLEGWDMKLSVEKNFPPCTKDDLECKAKGVLSSVAAILFR